MTKFLHISDLHFRKDLKNNAVQIQRLKSIQERFPGHRLIITGDIVDDGWKSQYDQALQALYPFKDRVFMCPGNHDFGTLGNLYNRSAQRRFQAFLQEFGLSYTHKYDPMYYPIPGDPDVLLIGLDSNLHTTHPFDFARGEVGKRQCQTLESILLRHNTGNCPIIFLCLHHHPFYRGFDGHLRDWKRFMNLISGHIDVLCFAHKHKLGYWKDKYHIPHICAADSLRDSRWVREILINQKKKILIKDLKL